MTDHFNRPEEDLLSYALDDQADLPKTMIVESLKRVIGEEWLSSLDTGTRQDILSSAPPIPTTFWREVTV